MRTVKVLAVEDSEFNRVVWFERPAESAALFWIKFVALRWL